MTGNAGERRKAVRLVPFIKGDDMEFHVKTLMGVLCVAAALAPHGASGQQTIDNWAITAGGDGKAVTMTYANPATYLKIESDLELSVDAAGSAGSGSIHFKNGVARAMTPGEVAFYFSEYRGDNAYWDFREKQNSITSLAFTADAIPQNFAGQQARAISKQGKDYIGVLSLLPGSPDWFTLNIRGSIMMFYKNAVKEIQVLK
jgi:hypothetical protein